MITTSATVILSTLVVSAQDVPDPSVGQFSEIPGETQWQYDSAVETLLPVPPEMINEFNRRLRESRRAAAHRPPPLRTLSSVDLVSLEPGQDPPTVRLAPRIATVVTFSDITGEPWPVAGFVVGDQANFDIRHPGGVDGQQGPSHLTMAPLAEAGWSNLVVELAGQPIPIALSLQVEPQAPHYRLDVQIMALGPNAHVDDVLPDRAPAAGSPELAQFIAAADLPDDSLEADVSDVDSTRVWLRGGPSATEMIVRTRHALLGPEWAETMSGPSGIRVYRMPVADALLFSVGGVAVIARVTP
ncbi:MAG: hypothetical protein OXE84_04845 [Rhodobacteraceae bacterium]|nr:hypothetical protein [Paracoccaceae bacterium]MCY4196582.1 hypothetical protein [Paracoccaceae bacterium]